MGTQDDGSTAEEWEEGVFGQSEEYARRVPKEREERLHEMIDEITGRSDRERGDE